MSGGARPGGRSASLDWATLTRALAEPSPESWFLIVRAGSALLRQEEEDAVSRSMRVSFRRAIENRLPHWPRELARHVPTAWPEEWRKIAEYKILEIDTYEMYKIGVCGDRRLRLSDGTQAVRLERRFVGAARSIVSEQAMRIGRRGEADLSGGLVLEIGPRADPDDRLEVTLELEVKSASGDQSDDQEQRERALRRRGAVYLVAWTIEEAVTKIAAARDRLTHRILSAAGTR